MPSVNLNITPQGPLVMVHIGVSGPRRDAMTKAGALIPDPVGAQLLIDTGASNTCLDPWVIQALGLTPSGVIQVHTPSTTAQQAHRCNQYDVSLVIPHPSISRVFNAIPVMEAPLKHQGIDGLLGRDVLSQCLFVYNGELKIYTLSF